MRGSERATTTPFYLLRRRRYKGNGTGQGRGWRWSERARSYFVLPLPLVYPSKKPPMKLQREKATSRRAARTFEGDHEEGRFARAILRQPSIGWSLSLARSSEGKWPDSSSTPDSVGEGDSKATSLKSRRLFPHCRKVKPSTLPFSLTQPVRSTAPSFVRLFTNLRPSGVRPPFLPSFLSVGTA